MLLRQLNQRVEKLIAAGLHLRQDPKNAAGFKSGDRSLLGLEYILVNDDGDRPTGIPGNCKLRLWAFTLEKTNTLDVEVVRSAVTVSGNKGQPFEEVFDAFKFAFGANPNRFLQAVKEAGFLAKITEEQTQIVCLEPEKTIDFIEWVVSRWVNHGLPAPNNHENDRGPG